MNLQRASAWPDRHRPEQSDRERLDTGKVRSLNLRSSGAPTHIWFENLKNALAAVGAGFEHVVKLNNYLTDIRAQLPLYRDVREGYVSTTNPPASTRWR